jgi:gamma-glutamylcyclotransferase (GGCT)/AIG2-like uncharacterized protein YtfP
MQTLFVYGTLEIPQVVKKLLGTTLPSESAVLKGFERYMLINCHYPGIIRQEGAQVEGVLLHGITPKYLQLLDRYEDKIYKRQVVQVTNSKGQGVDTWVYVVPPRYKKQLTSRPWNRDYFVNTHLKRFLNVLC